MLQTERLTLRELEPGDAAELARVLGDPKSMRFYPHPFSAAEVAGWIASARQGYADRGHGLWAVVSRDDGRFIGDCGLVLQTVQGREVLEIGYHVVPEEQGKGYATEAAGACREYAFGALGASYVCSIVGLDNVPSQHVAARVHRQMRPFVWKMPQRRMLLYESHAPPRHRP